MRKDIYLKNMLLSAGLLTAATATAINVPYAKAPEDGKAYILVSRSNPQNIWNRTDWDKAVVLKPYSAFSALNAITAHATETEGTWQFTNDEVYTDAETGETFTTTYYLGIPDGTCNLNINLYDPASWTVEKSDREGYYLLKAGEGQGNFNTQGGYLHMNGGNEYPIISEVVCGGTWFPDYYGGVERDDDQQPVLDESGFIIPLNPVSRYWAFVEVGDVDAYAAKVPLYTLLQGIEDNNLGDDTYKAGFQGAIDAALPYYDKEDFTADDLAAAKAIVDAKQALYKEIQNALALLGTATDAALQGAIGQATAAFNTQHAPEAMAAAQSTLKEAEVKYANQGSDITALGTNMSFEDLSTQGGTQTSGVAGAPYGWNVYVNGRQVATAAEVQAAGIANWHGANGDAEGEAMDGGVAFGLWTGGVPAYELSQTISGLENGTYTISAGVMVGANGDGSRRTTQRLFGNLNATYFAQADQYDESKLSQDEVYTFAGLEEPQTDRLLQQMSVDAYVYDGTLTFGLRTDGNFSAARRETTNPAGGDGWFKTDNYRIEKKGYIQADALAIYDHFATRLGTLVGEPMEKSVQDGLKATLADNKADAASSQEQINKAFLAMRDYYATAKKSADLYARLSAAYEQGQAALITYMYSASADDFSDLLMDISDRYSDGAIADDEVEAVIAQINEGIEQLKATSISLGDITWILKNPSFEDLSSQGGSVSDGAANAPAGWTLYVNGEQAETVSGGWCAINHGDNISVWLEDGTEIIHQYTDGEHLWGIWNSNMPEVELSQSFKNMPPGTYTLEADVMVQSNWAGDNTTTQRIFGNNSVQMWGAEGSYSELNLPADAVSARPLTYAGYYCLPGMEGLDSSDLLHPMKVTFGVAEDGLMTIGFRTNGINMDGQTFAGGGRNGQGWFKVDNFRLSYDSTEIPTAVGAVRQQDATAATAIYRLDGRKTDRLQRGINIVRTGDGKTRKVVY